MTPHTRTVAAASGWVRERLTEPRTLAPVLHRGPDAVYLDVAGTCLGVLSSAATAVPCGVRTPLERLPAALLAADQGYVGGGRLALGGAEVVVTRTLDTRVPTLPADDAARLAAILATTAGDRLETVAAELPRHALDQLAGSKPVDAVQPLLGRGSGLTPLGDDVLAGWLAVALAVGALGTRVPSAGLAPRHGRPADAPFAGLDPDRSPPAEAPATALRDAVTRLARTATTLLSATLLSCAARGEVLPEFRRLLLELPAGEGTPLRRCVSAVLAIGHTSGAGLLLGSLLALRHVASRSR